MLSLYVVAPNAAGVLIVVNGPNLGACYYLLYIGFYALSLGVYRVTLRIASIRASDDCHSCLITLMSIEVSIGAILLPFK